jgi:hypothetical protein
MACHSDYYDEQMGKTHVCEPNHRELLNGSTGKPSDSGYISRCATHLHVEWLGHPHKRTANPVSYFFFFLDLRRPQRHDLIRRRLRASF